MAKLFVVSDIHSYYDEFIKALSESGYDENNKDHYLIVLGDIFDRGDQSNEVYNYFVNHTERVILVKGNHEDLMIDCLTRGFFERHDVSNGTVKTIMTLGNQLENFQGIYPKTREAYDNAVDVAYAKVKPLIDSMLDYFETENYIFVHSWIPMNIDYPNQKLGMYRYMESAYEYNSKWRETIWGDDWKEARWHNSFALAQKGLNKTRKVIIFGHWHTSWWHSRQGNGPEFNEDRFGNDLTEEYGRKACFDIACDNKNNVVGIDACTAYSGKCNVLVLEDSFLKEE